MLSATDSLIADRFGKRSKHSGQSWPFQQVRKKERASHFYQQSLEDLYDWIWQQVSRIAWPRALEIRNPLGQGRKDEYVTVLIQPGPLRIRDDTGQKHLACEIDCFID